MRVKVSEWVRVEEEEGVLDEVVMCGMKEGIMKEEMLIEGGEMMDDVVVWVGEGRKGGKKMVVFSDGVMVGRGKCGLLDVVEDGKRKGKEVKSCVGVSG